MKSPMIIASLILPAALLAACKPALIPPVARWDIQAVSEENWKRSLASMSSAGEAEGPATGISLEGTTRLNTLARMPLQSAGSEQGSSLSNDLHAEDVDRSQQNKSLHARRSLALQLLYALSTARP